MNRRTGAVLLLLAALLALGGLSWRYRAEIRQGARFLLNTARYPDRPAPTTLPLLATAVPSAGAAITPPQRPIALPPGFGISVYAQGLEKPRMLAIGPDGDLYVAEMRAGRIVRLPDRDGDGLADGVEVAAEGFDRPNSLAFYRDGSLYVSEPGKVWRLSEMTPQGSFQKRDLILSDLPSDGSHITRTLLFSPDWRRLYVSIGSSCNVCDEADARRAAIVAYLPDGTGEQIYASGLRNAVGLTFRPGTDEMWVSNNGRDLLTDDLPPETIYIVAPGQDYGWPRCHSGRIIDPDLGGAGDCDGVSAPAVEMQAHSAPLGLTFYQGTQFPAAYQGDLFVAFHGSWNRSEPTGYKVVRIPIDDQGQPGPVEDFAVGWQAANGDRWGRPVDVISAPDGSLLLSDDSGGFIYRIFYRQP